jgi:hypothetical protein
MRKLFLHVGVHRTATTSIQRFMRANGEVLLGKGYLHPFGVARHNAVVSRMRYGTLSVTEFAQDLQRRMDGKGGWVQAAVVSDEDMSMIEDFSLFAPLAEFFDVKVVVSLRRQDLWLESWYLQNLKWQWNPSLAHLTFDEFFAARGEFLWIDYATRLGHYEAVFGPGSVIAGVFEEPDMPAGPIDAFLAMIGITDQAGFGDKLHHNSSLSPLATEFMRHLPLDEMKDIDRRVFEQASLALDKDLVSNGSKLIMPHARRLEVMAEHAAGNAAVARRYLGRDKLFHTPLPGPRDPLANASLPKDAAALMEAFVAPYVRALGAEVARLRLAAEAGSDGTSSKPNRPRQAGRSDRARPRS